MATEANESTGTNTLVVRNPCFGLPTGCPQCLSAYIYLKLSHLPFNLDYHLNYPDSDQIPYFETGDCVAYNDEKDGIIECLKRDVGDLDGGVSSLPDWIPTKVILTTWLADALEYELWVGCDASSAYSIYYSDLPCPIGKVLFWKKTHWVKQKHGLNKDNAQAKEEEESSTLRMNFLEHANLVRYVQQCKTELIEAGTSSSDPYFHADPSSSASRGRSNSSSKSKSRPKRKQQTKEEKTFRRRAKYFVVAQLVAVVLFLSIMPAYGDNADMELDDDYAGYGYDE
ncbi:mitochondrial outer membrane import complex protein METAXIN-like isoform X3 [Abrus precatorius]|uniref:Mitochondrial outer membrane import complex protein METAXIN-like isoform X3 n=1 Tax=Abrus precatorius TaxID=3816 RepID=A0A8B8K6J2_ABRPR|nr:mitochondrial outer membrane import complex protein METAXIN-like isoform X3 [Abrus precatorius]